MCVACADVTPCQVCYLHLPLVGSHLISGTCQGAALHSPLSQYAISQTHTHSLTLSLTHTHTHTLTHRNSHTYTHTATHWLWFMCSLYQREQSCPAPNAAYLTSLAQKPG